MNRAGVLLLLVSLLVTVPVLAQNAFTVGIDQTTRDAWNSIADQFTEQTGLKVTFQPYPASSLGQQVVLQGLTRSAKLNLVMLHKDWLTSLGRYLEDLSGLERRFSQEGVSLARTDGKAVGIWLPFSPDWFVGVLAWPDDKQAAADFLVLAGKAGETLVAEPSKVSPAGVIAQFTTKKIEVSQHNPKLDGSLESLLGAAQAAVGSAIGPMAVELMSRLPVQAQAALSSVAKTFGVPFSSSTSTVTVVLKPQAGRASAANVAAVVALGVNRAAIEASTQLIKVSVPLSELGTLAAQLAGISFIRPPYVPYPLAVTGQGVAAIGAAAFHTAGITGSGVRVAVIDLGFAGLSAAQARGDLPGSVQQVDLTSTGLESGITHGTAVAEIVHEVAPGAALTLIKIADEVDLDQAVTYCLDHGIQIINHSLGWYNTNFYDGTGTIADIAMRAISGGILWVNAGGNEAQSHWEGTFSDGNGDQWLDQSITFQASAGEQILLYMTWNDWPSASSDYDLSLYGPSGQVVATSAKRQTGTEEPTESIRTSAPATGTYSVRVKGTGSKRIEIYNLYQGLSPAIASSSILAPGNVSQVVTVGAIDYAHYATGPLEAYSSRGPTNDGRQKPDLCAPDNVTTGTSPYNPFAGTSGATPHATGAAALLLSRTPSLSEPALRAQLLDATVSMGSPNLYGRGRLVLSLPAPANQPPNATFTANPASAVVGASIAFNASGSSDPDGSIASFAWQFGDGSTGSGVTPSHSYSSPGTYTVRLTVTDNQGAGDSATRQVSVTTPANQPPNAAFNVSPSSAVVGASIAFNASGSSDPDGSITSFAWQFGDGSTGSGMTPSHSYGSPGTYTVRLTVTDNQGAADSATRQVSITSPTNQPPNAAFNVSPSSAGVGVSIAFNASGSSDPDGWITSFAWQFGDGTTSGGVTASHSYGSPGTYTVTLTVTDNKGTADSTTRQVSIASPANQPPDATFTASPSSAGVGVSIAFNGSGSSDPDGWITSFAWQFGDGATGSGPTASHSYGSPGTYTVRLTVTDNKGATDTTTRQVSIASPANQPPNASFTASPSSAVIGTPIAFNGSGSNDPDGWIASFAWQFGDGATGSGPTASHSYGSPGTYTVRLTVIDNKGATDTTTRQVSIASPVSQLAVQVSTAKASYQVGEGITVSYAVNREAYVYLLDIDASGKVMLLFPNAREPNNRVSPGSHTVPGAAYALQVSEPTGTETLVAFAATSRIPGFPTSYGSGFAVLSYDPNAFLSSVRQTLQGLVPPSDRAESQTSLTVLGAASQTGGLRVTSTPSGAMVLLDGNAVGPTPVSLNVATGTHTVLLQLPGHPDVTRQVTVGAGQTVTLQVEFSGPVQNQPPAATFSVSPQAPSVGQSVAFNAAASGDPDGWITAYLWDFGDGAKAGGVQASHTYGAAGSYLVRLTVTDNQGATGAATRVIVVGGAPTPGPGPSGQPPMGTTPGVFVWGTSTWHVTVNAGAGWTTPHAYRLELRTDGGFSSVNQTPSGPVVPLGVLPTPTDQGRTLVFEGSLTSGSVDYTFAVPSSKSVWMSLKFDVNGDGRLDESPSFVFLRGSMVHPPNAPFVVGLPQGASGALIPSMNFRVGLAITYTAVARFVMWSTDIETLEGR